MTSNEQTPSVMFLMVKKKVHKKPGDMEGTAALLLISKRAYYRENITYAKKVRAAYAPNFAEGGV